MFSCISGGTRKGGGFYDRLGADVGTKNPKKSALGTFTDRSGLSLLRLHRKLAISTLGPSCLPSPSIQPFYRYGGGGNGVGESSAAITIFLCSHSKNVPPYLKSARSINKCGQSRLFRIFGTYIGP